MSNNNYFNQAFKIFKNLFRKRRSCFCKTVFHYHTDLVAEEVRKRKKFEKEVLF